jgi:hypothetical protein
MSKEPTTECAKKKALDWGRRSGATFEAEKTAIIHFTRKAYKSNAEPFAIRGQLVRPKTQVKVLGMIMDAGLKYKEHIERAAAKGLNSAMELQRLRGLTPRTARQLFATTVAPVVDYASNVWMHACKYRRVSPINRVQRTGANAIVGTFLTVATSVAEAEAHIPSKGRNHYIHSTLDQVEWMYGFLGNYIVDVTHIRAQWNRCTHVDL